LLDEHTVHAVAPATVTNLPTGQVEQAVAPALGANEPAGQQTA
jgi:hypothetical protein